jgi:hypothetical protein
LESARSCDPIGLGRRFAGGKSMTHVWRGGGQREAAHSGWTIRALDLDEGEEGEQTNKPADTKARERRPERDATERTCSLAGGPGRRRTWRTRGLRRACARKGYRQPFSELEGRMELSVRACEARRETELSERTLVR